MEQRTNRVVWAARGGAAAFALALLAAAGLLRWRMAHSRGGAEPAGQSAGAIAAELPVYWQVPPFSFVDQAGKRVTDKDLLGHPWVADFVFTRCTTACPVETSRMILLQRRIISPDVRFVSFSVDPEHDTPAVLADYARDWNGGDPRWLLLSTTPRGLLATARGMKVAVQANDDPDNPIIHDSSFFLVDGRGQVRGIFSDVDLSAMRRLEAETLQLAGSAPNAPAAPGTGGVSAGAAGGERLYAALGCAACHNQSKIAPPLGGILGRNVHLDDGRTIVADDAYIRESIVNAAAKVVAGYAPLMPDYGDHLSSGQVNDLVAYLDTLPAPAGSGVAAGAATQQALAVDPVCGMKVHVETDTPQAAYQGKSFYFCSDRCRDRFIRAPGMFAATKAAQ